MKVGAFFIDKEGNLIGQQNTDRLDGAKWYYKLLAKVSKRYRNSLITLVPLDTSIISNEPTEWPKEGIKFQVATPIKDSKGRPNGVQTKAIIDEDYVKKMMNESVDKRWTIKPIK